MEFQYRRLKNNFKKSHGFNWDCDKNKFYDIYRKALQKTIAGSRCMSVIELAKNIAQQAHARQLDKAGQPYIAHIERVVDNLLRRWPDSNEGEIAAAWLHDIIEDTNWNKDFLLQAGISVTTVGYVIELTRPEGITYLDWIRHLAESGSLSAVKVKLADNEDNSNPARVVMIPGGDQMAKKRYRPAQEYLIERLYSHSFKL
jgi:(p)ppGpp synthase/HD superfamily hydrolase